MQIKSYQKKAVEEMLTSGATGGTIRPLAPLWGLAQISNPILIDTDVILWIGLESNEICAYAGIMPAMHKQKKVGWLTSFWTADEQYKEALVKEIEAKWDYIYADLSIDNYQSTFLSGTQFFCGSQQGIEKDNFFWQVVRGIINSKWRLFKKAPTVDYMLQKTCPAATKLGVSKAEQAYYGWIIENPWLVDGLFPDKQVYKFPVQAERFYFRFVKVTNTDGKAGFALIRIKNNKLLLIKTWTDDTQTGSLAVALIDIAKKLRLSDFVIYNQAVSDAVEYYYAKKGVSRTIYANSPLGDDDFWGGEGVYGLI